MTRIFKNNRGRLYLLYGIEFEIVDVAVPTPVVMTCFHYNFSPLLF